MVSIHKPNTATDKRIRRSKITFFVLQVFNGLSALAGGYGLITDPTGKALQMGRSMLANSPFDDFLIPGLILFIINGMGNATGSVLSMTKFKHAASVAAIFGVILMIWIISQVSWIGYQSILQPLYFTAGLAQFLAAYYCIKQHKKIECQNIRQQKE